MSIKPTTAERNHASSSAVPHNLNSSGVSRPAVPPLQKAAKDIEHTEDVSLQSPETEAAATSSKPPVQPFQLSSRSTQEKQTPHPAWHTVQQKQDKTPQLHQRMPSPATGNPVVQRVTGFEIETFIPLYKPVEGTDAYVAMDKGWSPDIGDFLFGGVLYGHTYGADPEGHFTVSADHNNKMTGPHRKLLHLLMLAGLIRMNSPFRGMAIAEYITSPIDETSPGAKERMQEQIAYTNAHIKNTIGLQGNMATLPMPDGNGVLTGIPVTNIAGWVRQNVREAGPIIAVLEELKAVAQEIALNMQETTGVLPEDIPALYQSATEKLEKNPARPEQIMSKVMQASQAIASKALAKVKVTPSPSKHTGAINGFLTYLATHVIVDNLSVSNYIPSSSTPKNLFPYFPKVPLSTAFQAMPPETQDPQYTGYWEALIDAMIDGAYSYDRTYWETNFKLGQENFQSSVFQDKSSTKEVYKKEARALLKKMVSPTHPEVHINIEKNLPGLDTPHPQVEQITGQKAIPMEDRYFNNKYGMGITTENMEAFTLSEFDEASARMHSHMQPDIEDVNTPSARPTAPNELYTKGRYRDLQRQAASLRKYHEESEGYVISTREHSASIRLELEKLRTRDEAEVLLEKEQITTALEELEAKRDSTQALVDEQQESMNEQMDALTAQQDELNTQIMSLIAPEEEPEDKTAARKKLAKLQLAYRKLSEDINNLQDAIYKVEDDLIGKLNDEISDKNVELFTYTPEYQQQVENSLLQSEQGEATATKNARHYKALLDKTELTLTPMIAAESSGNTDVQTWKEFQATAAKAFLAVKKELWEFAHAENPNAGLLTKPTLFKEYKDSLGIDKTNEAGDRYVKSLARLKVPQKQEQIDGVASQLTAGMKTLKTMTELLESKVGNAPPDEILELLNNILTLNQRISEDVTQARQLVSETNQ